MKNFYFLASFFVAFFAFSSCSDDTEENKETEKGGNVKESHNVVVLSYDKFLEEDDVEIIQSDTSVISVSMEYLDVNDIDVTVGDEQVPLVVWRSVNTVPFVRNITKAEVKGDKMELTTVSGDLGDVFPDTEFDLNTDLYVNPTQMKSVLRAGKEFVNPDRYIDEEGDFHPAVYIVHEEVTTVNENGEFETLRSGGEPKSYTAEELFADNADFKILNIDKSFADINVNLLEGEEAGKVYLYAKDNYIKAVAGLRVNVNTKRFNLKKFECVTYGEFLAQTTLGVKAEIEYQKNLDKKVAKFGKCTSVFWVGIVPVAITSEIGLRVKGGFEFNGECDIYTNLDFHANYELGAVYENGWRSVKKGSAGTEAGLNLNTNVEMEAKSNLSVLVYANVLVYGCTGPEVNVGPKAEVNASARLATSMDASSANAELEGKYQMGLSVGGEVKAEVKVLKWSLAKWSTPFTIWEGISKEDSIKIAM